MRTAIVVAAFAAAISLLSGMTLEGAAVNAAFWGVVGYFVSFLMWQRAYKRSQREAARSKREVVETPVVRGT